MTLLLVVIGAMVGAPLRFVVDRAVQSRHETGFPWGTLAVNMSACLILGVLAGAGAAIGPSLNTLIGTGFCGALSTYSTFSYETVSLVQGGARFFALLNVSVMLIAGLGAAALGWSLGVAFT